MSQRIHETAIVSKDAAIGQEVEIGPYSIIGEGVTLKDNVKVGPHAVIEGDTVIGEGCRIFQFASIGSMSQDLKDTGGEGKLVVGSGNTFREFVTINCGTPDGGGMTTIGDNCFFMAYAHVAHDCRIGNFVVMANVATLAGHVTVEDFAGLGGLVAVHQFVKIGEHTFIGGGSMTSMDIAPYMKVSHGKGARAKVMGPNVIGLDRRGFTKESITAIKGAYKIIWRSNKMLNEALKEAEGEFGEVAEVKHLIDFIRSSERGLLR